MTEYHPSSSDGYKEHNRKDERNNNYRSISDSSSDSQEELTNEIGGQSGSDDDDDAYLTPDEMDAEREDPKCDSDHLMNEALKVAKILSQMKSTDPLDQEDDANEPLDWEQDVNDPIEVAMAKYKVGVRTDKTNTLASTKQQEPSKSSMALPQDLNIKEQPSQPEMSIEPRPFRENIYREDNNEARCFPSFGRERDVGRDRREIERKLDYQERGENRVERIDFKDREVEGRNYRVNGEGRNGRDGECFCEERKHYGANEERDMRNEGESEDKGAIRKVIKQASKDRENRSEDRPMGSMREIENEIGLGDYSSLQHYPQTTNRQPNHLSKNNMHNTEYKACEKDYMDHKASETVYTDYRTPERRNTDYGESERGYTDDKESEKGHTDYKESERGHTDYNESEKGYKERERGYTDFKESDRGYTDYKESEKGHTDYKESERGHTDYKESERGHTDYNESEKGYKERERGYTDFKESDRGYTDFKESDRGYTDYKESDRGYTDYKESDRGYTDYKESDRGCTDYKESERGHTDYKESERGHTDYKESGRGYTDYKGSDRGYTDYKESDRGYTDYNESDRGYTDYKESDRGHTDYKESGRGYTDYKESERGHTDYKESDRGRTGYKESDRGRTDYKESDRGRTGYKEYERGYTVYPCNEYEKVYTDHEESERSCKDDQAFERDYNTFYGNVRADDTNFNQPTRGASSLTSLNSDSGRERFVNGGHRGYRGGDVRRYDGGRAGYRGRGRGRGRSISTERHYVNDGVYMDGGNGGYGYNRYEYGGGRERGQYRDIHNVNETGSGGGRVKPRLIVEALVEYPDFCASLLNLVEGKGLHPSKVRETVEANSHVFKLHGEKIKLWPSLGLCRDHVGQEGCSKQSECRSLHLCPSYVRNWCQNRQCPYGHLWHTDHNKKVLRLYYLEYMPYQLLKNLIQEQLAAMSSSARLNVCNGYNKQGCTRQDCPDLHICCSFVKGLTKCEIKDCRLNHDFYAPHCSQLLRSRGISTNEAPRDIAMALKQKCPSLSTTNQYQPKPPASQNPSTSYESFTRYSASRQSDNVPGFLQRQKTPTSDTWSGGGGGGRGTGILSLMREMFTTNSGKTQESPNGKDSNKKGNYSTVQSSKTNGKDDSSRMGGRGQSREKRDDSSGAGRRGGAPTKKEKTETVWSHYLYGDTEINEICYYSVEGQCRNESSGCQRLHSAQHYHWQVSEQGSKWFNLRPFQSSSLERAYCDPNKDGASIPRLDPAKLSQSLGKLLIVMGRETWQGNFQAMVLCNSDQSRILYLRRLCTQYIQGQKVSASVHSWYFRDKNSKFIKYGNVDTAGERTLVSSVTSADIEKHYWTQQHKPLTFQNASYKYILDFVAMTQTNQGTQVKREVRRRPEPHLTNDNSQDGNGQATGTQAGKDQASSSKVASKNSSSSLPSFWEPMQNEERLRMVTVQNTSAEYRSVAGLVGGGNINTGNIVKIERIQNPFFWRALQNKIRDMTLVYGGDVKKVDVRQLFHGTKADVVASICAENFDWRLHGSSTGQACGRGVYFSPQFGTSYGYCRPDSAGFRYIFVARVAVGSIIGGNSSTVRPPTNPSTGLPYDSTGDGVSVVVKYDKQEYCPEYILTLR